jgi:hypothetical protein
MQLCTTPYKSTEKKSVKERNTDEAVMKARMKDVLEKLSRTDIHSNTKRLIPILKVN